MRRLGVEILICDVCGKPFKLSRNPLWFVLRMFEGEIADDGENDDPFCGETCAKKRAEELNKRAEKATYVAWPNERWNP